VSRQVISRIERGELRSIPIGTIAKVAEALEAYVDLTVRWRGEQLEKLMDATHAELVRNCVGLLGALGWMTRVEVSFNHYGDRGRVDVLALHSATGTLLVIEVKSAIGDVQDTLGRLDVKARLGSTISGSIGWKASVVVPALVVAESRTTRRLLSKHAPLFARFAVRGRQARGWLRRPGMAVPTGLLLFVTVTDSRGGVVTRNARVRTVNSAS
jgi:hypothetical protein